MHPSPEPQYQKSKFMRKKLQPIIFLVLPFCLWGQPFSSTPVINPFGITPAQSHYRFAFDDLDGDGDTDILALDQFGNDWRP